ncbi:MAG: hypothetical protein GTO13_02930 [Proteobacteria bacterium]|nr:hypothetical protein [Pseudomonadota bacterium]
MKKSVLMRVSEECEGCDFVRYRKKDHPYCQVEFYSDLHAPDFCPLYGKRQSRKWRKWRNQIKKAKKDLKVYAGPRRPRQDSRWSKNKGTGKRYLTS